MDEKSQCQALERSQPMLPLDLGYVEGVTHDYLRHGTTTLFAALDVANGQVLTDCKPRHRHQEFLAFLRHIDSNVPEDLEVHLIVDNYSPHKHAKVKAWLARHPRYQMHFIPTYASWLNQVERWFGLITQRTIRRGSLSSVKQLISKIDEFVQAYNRTSKPFMWYATADSILAKIERLCNRIFGDRRLGMANAIELSDDDVVNGYGYDPSKSMIKDGQYECCVDPLVGASSTQEADTGYARGPPKCTSFRATAACGGWNPTASPQQNLLTHTATQGRISPGRVAATFFTMMRCLLTASCPSGER